MTGAGIPVGDGIRVLPATIASEQDRIARAGRMNSSSSPFAQRKQEIFFPSRERNACKTYPGVSPAGESNCFPISDVICMFCYLVL